MIDQITALIVDESKWLTVSMGLNLWLVLTLLALGIHNLPLAAPGLFNIAYHLHARRSVGMIVVSLAILVHIGLFVGSLIFFATGQSFEQFQGVG